MKMLKKASFTVEISLLMPIILFVIFAVLYLCFYLHSEAWYTAAAYEVALTGSMEGVKKDADIQEVMEQKVQKQKSTIPIGVQNLHSNTEFNTSRVKVAYEANIISVYGGLSWSIQVTAESKIIKPVVFIRKAKITSEIVGKIKE